MGTKIQQVNHFFTHQQCDGYLIAKNLRNKRGIIPQKSFVF